MLFERLIGDEDEGVERIPVNAFASMFAEGIRDRFDREDLIAAFDLEASDITDLDDLIELVDALPLARQFEFGQVVRDSLILAAAGIGAESSEEWLSRLREFV